MRSGPLPSIRVEPHFPLFMQLLQANYRDLPIGAYRWGRKVFPCNSLRDLCTLIMRNRYPAYA